MHNLMGKTAKELRALAKELGIGVQQHEDMQSLRARIMITLEPGIIDSLTPPPINPVEQKARPKEVSKMLTPQEVMAALEPFKGKLQLAFYDTDGNPTQGETATTWHVKNGPAEDSGSLTIALKWIRFKAQEIANARFPAVIKGEFEDVRKIPVLA